MVDYFEATPGPTALAEVNKLLAWWTRYAAFILSPYTADEHYLDSKIFGGHPLSSHLGQQRIGASVSKLAMQRAARELLP